MPKNNLKALIVILSCFFVLLASGVKAQELKITSIANDGLLEGGIYVKGQSAPNTSILLSIKEEKGLFSYSAKTESDAHGSWSADLDQPLKSGQYYIEASSQDGSTPVMSGIIKIKGPFGLMINIFSLLVLFLLVCFLCIWYASRAAEIKRYRRILSSQRDIILSYNLLKKDVDEAIDNLIGEKEDRKIHAVKFFLDRVNGNLEKMNKYVMQGVNLIGKYDIVSKIDNKLKLKKTKKHENTNS